MAGLNSSRLSSLLLGQTPTQAYPPADMKVLLSMLVATALAEPPVDYVTTHQDAFAPPPPPASLYAAPSYASPATAAYPSAAYGAPLSRSYSRYSGLHHQKNYRRPASHYATTAAIYSGAPTSHYNSAGTGPFYGAPSAHAGHKYNSYDDLAEPANYEFSYVVEDGSSGNDFGHREWRQGDFTWGSYSVVLPDGRRQIVEYQADQHGYRPTVRYEQARSAYRSAPY